ncbi:MAG: DUF6398 domain-containing protein [Planctomycetota bacterium]|nr:DUF6398 domain-containing protein [Planctomycetota bacterium]
MAHRNVPHPSADIPADVRPKYKAITALTDAFCKRHLNEEYAELCRRLTVALARKRPTPLIRGREDVWACGIVRTIGWANVLDDPKQSPYMKLIAIDPEFGVAESTGQGRSKDIRRMFGIGRLNPDWTLPSRLGDNPLVWKVEVNGMLVDIRQESREEQEAAFQEGLIPYIPADIPADRTPIMDDQSNKPADTPSFHALEGGLFGTIFGFHQKLMTLLRGAGLADDKLGVASERIGHLLDTIKQDITVRHDLNIQPRLDAMYEEVQRLVDELVELGSIRDQMEKIYSETPPADIPWNIELPPKALTELIESGQVHPCKTIDLGCGAGNYAIYLASLGFDVTGVDISPSAIALAEANAKQKGVSCRFLVVDNHPARSVLWHMGPARESPAVSVHVTPAVRQLGASLFHSFSSGVSFRELVSFEGRASSRRSSSSFPSSFSDSDDTRQGFRSSQRTGEYCRLLPETPFAGVTDTSDFHAADRPAGPRLMGTRRPVYRQPLDIPPVATPY